MQAISRLRCRSAAGHRGMPISLKAECGYLRPLCTTCGPCTYCATPLKPGWNSNGPLDYLGETETSHYYVSSIQTTLEELRSEWSLNWSTFSHLIRIDNAAENESVLT